MAKNKLLKNYPQEFIEHCKAVKAKRPRTVIEHILKHGFITTEILKEHYGYNHPPRAAREVKEHGIPVISTRVIGKDGRRMAHYVIGDLTNWNKNSANRFQGRSAFSKEIKKELLEKQGAICAIYREPFNPAKLQIDHRIPYTVAGDEKETTASDFMLICPSANMAKSHECENCENNKKLLKVSICKKCYWAFPESDYEHIAMKPIRRLDILWFENEVKDYDGLKKKIQKKKVEMPDYVKKLIRDDNSLNSN